MNQHGYRIFIVNSDPLMASILRNFLDHRFENLLNISTFYNLESAYNNVDAFTDMFVYDSPRNDSNDPEILSSVSRLNEATVVMIHSKHHEIATTIEMRSGIGVFQASPSGRYGRIWSIPIEKMITYPIQVLTKEFGISKFLAVLLVLLLTIGLAVFISMKLMQ